MLQEYKYQCDDHSLVTPGFKKWIVAPCLKLVHWSIPANVITIFSNIFFYIALYLALTMSCQEKQWILVVIPLLIFLYALGDHLDGMQAKRTKTGSALGEFCDHYLDVFNNGILLIILIRIFGVTNPFIIAFLFFSSYLAHAATIYEEFKTKWLVFEKFGSLEAVFMAIFIILLGLISPVYQFLRSSVYASFTVMDIFCIISGIGGIATFFKIGTRVKNFSPAFYLYIVGSLALAVFSAMYLDGTRTFLLFILFNGEYIGKIMRGHLVDGVERNPDLILIPFILCILFCFRNEFSLPFLILALYYTSRITILIVIVFSALRMFWHWKNPELH